MNVGDIVRVKTGVDGDIYEGQLFTVDGEQRECCESMTVRLTHSDGTLFSPAYAVSMIELAETKEVLQ